MIVLISFGGSCTRVKNAQKHAEKALAATVTLEMSDTRGQLSSYGSGFFVSPTHIVTNFHVVVRTDNGTAKLVDKTETYPIQDVVATDPENDLAIIKVAIPGIKPLLLGDSDEVRIGDHVYVAGNPKGLEGTFSEGIISRISNQETKKRLQMTAPISPGSSGGPVLNSKGNVIGVTFMTIIDGQNLNFAIPAKYVKALLDSKDGKKNISAEFYFIQGNKKYEQGLYKSAILDYDTAIWLNSDYVNVYIKRGTAKAQLDQHTAAIADFETAIQLKPDSVEAYIGRGIAKYKQGQTFSETLQAKLDFQTALSIATRAGNVQLKNEIESLLRKLK